MSDTLRERTPDEAAAWVARCLARMQQLDPVIDHSLVEPIVRDMERAIRWRTATPEEAADWCFGPLNTQPRPGNA